MAGLCEERMLLWGAAALHLGPAAPQRKPTRWKPHRQTPHPHPQARQEQGSSLVSWFLIHSRAFQAGGRTAQGRNDVTVGKGWSQMSQSPGAWGPHQPATRQMAPFSFQHLGYRRGIFSSPLWTSSFLISKMGEITSQGCREDSIIFLKKTWHSVWPIREMLAPALASWDLFQVGSHILMACPHPFVF